MCLESSLWKNASVYEDLTSCTCICFVPFHIKCVDMSLFLLRGMLNNTGEFVERAAATAGRLRWDHADVELVFAWRKPQTSGSSAPAETDGSASLCSPSFVCVIQLELINRVQTKLRQGYRDLSQSLTSHRRSTGDEEERNLLPDEGTCITNSFPIHRCVLHMRSWRESAASSWLLKVTPAISETDFMSLMVKKKKKKGSGQGLKY